MEEKPLFYSIIVYFHWERFVPLPGATQIKIVWKYICIAKAYVQLRKNTKPTLNLECKCRFIVSLVGHFALHIMSHSGIIMGRQCVIDPRSFAFCGQTPVSWIQVAYKLSCSASSLTARGVDGTWGTWQDGDFGHPGSETRLTFKKVLHCRSLTDVLTVHHLPSPARFKVNSRSSFKMLMVDVERKDDLSKQILFLNGSQAVCTPSAQNVNREHLFTLANVNNLQSCTPPS